MPHVSAMYCQHSCGQHMSSATQVRASVQRRSLTYGEPEWRAKTEQALADMETHDPVVQHAFEHTLGWLEHWACSRSFGLGTKIPWDTEFLVESLSDSTIYMAYYTVAHILQEGNMFGDHRGAVKPEAMTHVRPRHASGCSCSFCVGRRRHHEALCSCRAIDWCERPCNIDQGMHHPEGPPAEHQMRYRGCSCMVEHLSVSRKPGSWKPLLGLLPCIRTSGLGQWLAVTAVL